MVANLTYVYYTVFKDLYTRIIPHSFISRKLVLMFVFGLNNIKSLCHKRVLKRMMSKFAITMFSYLYIFLFPRIYVLSQQVVNKRGPLIFFTIFQSYMYGTNENPTRNTDLQLEVTIIISKKAKAFVKQKILRECCSKDKQTPQVYTIQLQFINPAVHIHFQFHSL